MFSFCLNLEWLADVIISNRRALASNLYCSHSALTLSLLGPHLADGLEASFILIHSELSLVLLWETTHTAQIGNWIIPTMNRIHPATIAESGYGSPLYVGDSNWIIE